MKTQILRFVFLAAIVLFGVAVTTMAFLDPTLSMSKKNYSVGEAMVLNGAGWSPNAVVTVKVERPDKLIDIITPAPATDGSGSFTATYLPPSIPGRYNFTATDGVNTAKIATTGADAIGYNKAVFNKDDTDANGLGGGSWTTGNAGSNYLENQWVFYQYQITGIGTTPPTFDVTFNHYQSNTNAVFVDGFSNLRACVDCTEDTQNTGNMEGMLQDGKPAPQPGSTVWVNAISAISKINHPFVNGACQANPDPVDTPSEFHCFHVDGDALRDLFPAGTFTTGTHTITLFYEAHLAATAVWSHGKEYLLGCDSDPSFTLFLKARTGSNGAKTDDVWGTDAYNPLAGPCGYSGGSSWDGIFQGIGAATGSSRQFNIDNQSEGSSGALALPIPSVPAPTGSITIVKVTNPTPATEVFNFTSQELGNFTLDTNPATAGILNTITFSSLSGGFPYVVTEGSLPAGWTLQNLVCADTSGTNTSVVNGATATITLAPTSGAAVTCTYTNVQAPHLTLHKVVINDNGGTAVATDWTLSAAGPSSISGVDGAAAVTNATVQPGTYGLSESGPAGYTASSWVCVGGTQNGSDITLAYGQSATCTITNNDNAPALHLRKVVVNDNGGTATVADFTLAAAGTTPLSGTSPVDSGATFSAGTYALSETLSAAATGKYTASGWVCVGGSQNGSNITVGLGESATCTITNNDNAPALHLRKVVVNDNGGTATVADFTLSATGTTPLSGTSPVDSDATFSAGTYALSETPSAAAAGKYTASAWVCVGGAQNGANITVGLGESATCTITNNDNAPALHLRKVVVNDNGGTATVADFTLAAAGPTALSGTSPVDSGPAFSQGTYALSETLSAAADGKYTASAWVCVGGSQNGANITVGLGESATCTITNDDNAPGLHLRKVVVNDNGGTATVADFTLAAAGPTPLSGTSPVDSGPTFSQGTYALSETLSAAADGKYTASSWVCVGGSQSGAYITVGLGESATCTITNNDNAPGLHLRKIVVNNNGGTATAANWTLTANGGASGTLSGAGPAVDSDATFQTGTYALSESGPGGYAASAWVCVGGSQNGSNITVGLGESATCTITNDDITAHLTLVKVVVNNNGGTAVPNDFLLSAAGPTPISAAGGVSSDVNAGTYALSETTLPGYTPSNWVCSGGTANGASIALALGESATCTITNDDQPSYIVINKLSKGGTGTFGFTIAGPTSSTPSITTSGSPDGTGTTGTIQVNTGDYTVNESSLPASWALTASTCTVDGATPFGTPTEVNGVNTSWAFTLPLGTTVMCTFDNSLTGTATRTQGFWATHTGLSNNFWNTVVPDADKTLCSVPITAIESPGENQMMGGFWANIAQKTTNPKKRSDLDQARMQMLQQYLAAVLNVNGIGTPGPDLAAARTDYCGTDVSKIKDWIGVLGDYNTSGDSITWTPGTSATAKESRSQANIPFWNDTTH